MSTEITSITPKSDAAIVANSGESTQVRASAFGRMIDNYGNDLIALLPRHIEFERMKQLFILACKRDPKLLNCDPSSLMQAVFTASSMGLEPDPHHGQVYLIPYGKTAQVVPGYKGLLQLVRNTGEINSINAQAVCENDYFEYDLASGERPKHKPPFTNRGKAVAYYCLANFNSGGFHFELMNIDEIEVIRLNSAAVKSALKNNKKTPWDTDYDEMAKKTVIRRAVKRLPISLDRRTRVSMAADDAYNEGRPFKIDHSTGEAVDIWSAPVDPETGEVLLPNANQTANSTNIT